MGIGLLLEGLWIDKAQNCRELLESRGEVHSLEESFQCGAVAGTHSQYGISDAHWALVLLQAQASRGLIFRMKHVCAFVERNLLSSLFHHHSPLLNTILLCIFRKTACYQRCYPWAFSAVTGSMVKKRLR